MPLLLELCQENLNLSGNFLIVVESTSNTQRKNVNALETITKQVSNKVKHIKLQRRYTLLNRINAHILHVCKTSQRRAVGSCVSWRSDPLQH